MCRSKKELAFFVRGSGCALFCFGEWGDLMRIISDLAHGTSHSVSFVLDESPEKALSKYGILLRKPFAPLLRLIYRTQTKYRIIVNRREPLPHDGKGTIFVLNHRQADDIVIGANAVGKSAYIVFGNPYLALETTNGLGLWAYGMILFHRDRPSMRKATYAKMKYVLQHGGCIIIYPEGYWNLDDNGEADERHDADGHRSETRLMQDINLGVIRLAKETGCRIVPTALHYDETGKKRCYVRRGHALSVNPTDDVFQRKDELVDTMQSMLYELMEKYSTYHRTDLETDKPLSEQWDELKESLRVDCDIPKIGYRLDLADEKRIGKAKVGRPVTTHKEAFAFLDVLNPSRANAFLFNKRLHG